MSYDNMAVHYIMHRHFPRQRINKLLIKSLGYPLVEVTANAGWGKTQAVSVFLDDHQDMCDFVWMQLSHLDNYTPRFWESFVNILAADNPEILSQILAVGFPDTLASFHAFLQKLSNITKKREKFILVFDDFHLIEELSIKLFVKNLVCTQLKNFSVILISRKNPDLNLQKMSANEFLFEITEDDLSFTKTETEDYFWMQGIELAPKVLDDIWSSTEGWISRIYLIRLYLVKNSYETEKAIKMAKHHIFELIDQEIFSKYPQELQNALIKLSLFENFTIDIVKELLESNISIFSGIEKMNMFIQFNIADNTYRFHSLFSEFLFNKSKYLANEEIDKIYLIAARWYQANGYNIDAIEYYQKCGHYEEIWDIIRRYDIAMPPDVADLFLNLIGSFPENFHQQHPLIAVVHARLLLNNGLLKESRMEFQKIIKTYETMPQTLENKSILGETYLFLGMIGLLTFEDKFNEYYKKADEYLPEGSVLIDNRLSFVRGNYMILIKDPTPGELDRYLNLVTDAMPYAAKAMNGSAYGVEYACKAEADYYTGNIHSAENNAYKAIYKAQQQNQFDTIFAAYFVLIRICIYSGDYLKSVDYMKELEDKIENCDPYYIKNCLYTYDILKGWYYEKIGCDEKIPEWILNREKMIKVSSPNHLGNDKFIYACYLLEKEKYNELSVLIEELEIYHEVRGLLITRIYVKIFKSITSYKLQDFSLSLKTFEDAYNLSHGNNIIIPFIEFGKHMRTVVNFIKQNETVGIPTDWLNMIHAKSSTYAKQASNIKSAFKKAAETTGQKKYNLTKKEKEILRYLCQGLTVKETSGILYISTSTVRQALNNIYEKLGAAGRTDAIRIAAQMDLDK